MIGLKSIVKSSFDYAFAVLASIGAVLSFIAAFLTYNSPPSGTYLDPKIPVYVVLVVLCLYAALFLFAPTLVLEMNFDHTADKYHKFVSRQLGFAYFVLAFLAYNCELNMVYPTLCVMAGGLSLISVTFAMLFLEPIQTPTGHGPAPILCFIFGVLLLVGCF